MTPERHQQIKRLFLAAVELAPNEVQPFLDQACGEDVDLRGEVQSLIDHHRTETLLNETATQNTAIVPTTTLLSAMQEGGLASATSGANVAAPRPAGTMIDGRYRLESPLGRGGMGVVYRAEDTELSQTIALKFLSPKLQQRPDAIEFLRREVRTARQITHPNVVRIFDIGTSDTEVFISMEYVAGEDLESLVRRVGPLPGNKVFQIALELAAGLTAAHEAGILHRDLKPPNVMIDGAGKVRILDFGIASPLNDEQSLRKLSGTPGFLAPELLAGEKPSQRSDLYAWGIVVYFAAMGRLPKAGDFVRDEEAAELLVSSGVPAEVADCICSCLQADPARRPESAHALTAALCGGDPLGEALRAGSMPSPELVKAASSWQPSPVSVDLLLGAGVVLLFLVMLLADRTLFLTRCGLVKSPEVLQDVAEQVLVGLGHSAPISPVFTEVTLDTDCLQFIRDHRDIADAWKKVASGEIPAVSFSYWQGEARLPRPELLGGRGRGQMQPKGPGAATIRLDGRGKLLSLQVASSLSSEQHSVSPTAWQSLFELAGLPWSEFREVPAKRWPPLFADIVHTWEGPFAADPNLRVHVMAASLGGRVVFFDVDQPWATARPFGAGAASSKQFSRFLALRTAMWLVVTGLAAVLAWRHVQQGHADWRGAWRVTAAVLFLAAFDWLWGARHSFVLTEELTADFDWLQVIVFCGAVAGMGYLAVEPSARRWWPWSIITMRRLLDGWLTDRGIWADGLLGLVVGVGCVLLRQVCTVGNQLLGVAVSGLNDFDPSQNLLDHFGLRYKVAVFITALLMAVLESLLLLTLVVALKRLVKSTLVAAVLLVLMLAVGAIIGRGIVSPVDWLARSLLLSIAAWILIRYGLLATMTALAAYYAVNNAPLTLDSSRWFAGTGFVVVATVAAALAACWRLARAR